MSGIRITKPSAILIIVIAISLFACASQDTPKPQSHETIPADESASREAQAFIYRKASLEDIEIQLLESPPRQVHVVAKGYLSDGCTKIDRIKQERTDDVFSITITTIRPTDLNCIQVIVPFEETIPLDVLGLKAGVYTVTVNDMSDTFTLEKDNMKR